MNSPTTPLNTSRAPVADRIAFISTKKSRRFLFTVSLIGGLGLFTATNSRAVNQTWTNSDGTNPLQWDTTSTNWSGAAWTNNNIAIFGATGAGTIVVGSAITATGTSQINANGYKFTGASLSLANLTLAAGISSEFDNNLTASGTVTVNHGTLTLGGGGTFGPSSQAAFIGDTAGGTITFTTGSYTFSNGAAISNGTSGTSLTVNFNGDSTFASNGTSQFGVGYNTGASGSFNYNSTGASTFAYIVTLGRAGNSTFTQTAGSLTSTLNSAFAVQVCNGNGLTGLLDLQGGSFTLNGGSTAAVAVNNNTTGTGSLLVEGGTLTTPNIQLNSATGGTSTVTLLSGTINTDTITTANGGTKTINLNGGTLGTNTSASATWAPAMVLGGNVTIRAAKADGITSANITLSGLLSGSGGFTKIGAGTLTLSNGLNSYSGLTTINAGTVATGATGTFGTGNILVNAGGTLTLGNNASIGDTANVVFDSTLTTGAKINLNYTLGTAETINSLSSISGTSIGPGTYDFNALNGFFSTNVFAGNGSLTILTSAIPEPSTYAAIFSAMALCGACYLRRQRTITKAA